MEKKKATEKSPARYRIGIAAAIAVTGIILNIGNSQCFCMLDTYWMEVSMWWLRGASELRQQTAIFGMLHVPLLAIVLVCLTLFGGLLASRVRRLLLIWLLTTEGFLSIVLFFLSRVPFGVYYRGNQSFGYPPQEVWEMVSSPQWAPFYPPLWLLSRGYALGSLIAYSALVSMFATAFVIGAKRLWRAKGHVL